MTRGAAPDPALGARTRTCRSGASVERFNYGISCARSGASLIGTYLEPDVGRLPCSRRSVGVASRTRYLEDVLDVVDIADEPAEEAVVVDLEGAAQGGRGQARAAPTALVEVPLTTARRRTPRRGARTDPVRFGRSAHVVDLGKPVDRCGDAFHPRLELK